MFGSFLILLLLSACIVYLDLLSHSVLRPTFYPILQVYSLSFRDLDLSVPLNFSFFLSSQLWNECSETKGDDAVLFESVKQL